MPHANAFPARILAHARSHNLIVDDGTNYLYPCYDGVLDEKLYFASQPKVLFVCKEPYDDFWEDGRPYGGNVAIYEKFSDYENVYKNYVAYRTIADVLYAVHHDVCYDEVQQVQKIDVARELLGAAIINVGKMPAQITSPDVHMKEMYDIWKPILFEQIKYFSPEVIVFGYTMNLFRYDLFADRSAPACKMYGGDMLGSFIHEGKLLLDAFHPSARKNKAAYVDTIVAAVRDWKAKIT